MYRKISVLLVLAASILLPGCAHWYQLERPLPVVKISIVDQDRIRFTGKGAGAGMMMSSSMGSMGIAIGVAIDEGIGKSIHSAYENVGGDYSELLRIEAEQWLLGLCKSNRRAITPICGAEQLELLVYRYGFITTAGDNDPVQPDLDIRVQYANEGEIKIVLEDDDIAEAVIPLESAKTDGRLVENSLRVASLELLVQLTELFE